MGATGKQFVRRTLSVYAEFDVNTRTSYNRPRSLVRPTTDQLPNLALIGFALRVFGAKQRPHAVTVILSTFGRSYDAI